ncbi:hypothetical protein [Curtobacterium sp. HSID17257]|uniref:hypothetical protein n=1 Tax=Curtobacterium sp. HSID17257 TaxID=2419510 RepID=UPI000F895FBD|nr:hypothetical protein [Curtobacterium sp. HSID17257]
MTRRAHSASWAIVSVALAVVALVICVVSIVEAGQVAPVFSWPVPQGADVVLTKQQYELALTAQLVGRIAAAVAVVLGLAAVLLSLRARDPSRFR